MGQPALTLLLDLASHRDPKIRSRVAPVLAKIGGAKAEKALRKLMEDENLAVRDLARGFLLETTRDGELKRVDKLGMFRIQTLGSLIVTIVGEEGEPIIVMRKPHARRGVQKSLQR